MIERLALALALVLALSGARPVTADGTLVVGSKKFTESVVLGELIAHALRDAGSAAEHQADLGGTRVLFSARERGDIDAYAEYTGTLRLELLGDASLDEDGMRAALKLHTG